MESLLYSRDCVRHFSCSNSLKLHIDCNDFLIIEKENWSLEKLSNLSKITQRGWATWLRIGRLKDVHLNGIPSVSVSHVKKCMSTEGYSFI